VATPCALESRTGFYYLLCMFNGFAFARPLCGAIKGLPEAVGLGWRDLVSGGDAAREVVILPNWGRRDGWGRSADTFFSRRSTRS
jgi:hypothetical protein